MELLKKTEGLSPVIQPTACAGITCLSSCHPVGIGPSGIDTRKIIWYSGYFYF